MATTTTANSKKRKVEEKKQEGTAVVIKRIEPKVKVFTTNKWPGGLIISPTEDQVLKTILEKTSIKVVERPDISELFKRSDMVVGLENGRLMGQRDVCFRSMGIKLPPIIINNNNNKGGGIVVLSGSKMKLFVKRPEDSSNLIQELCNYFGKNVRGTHIKNLLGDNIDIVETESNQDWEKFLNLNNKKNPFYEPLFYYDYETYNSIDKLKTKIQEMKVERAQPTVYSWTIEGFGGKVHVVTEMGKDFAESLLHQHPRFPQKVLNRVDAPALLEHCLNVPKVWRESGTIFATDRLGMPMSVAGYLNNSKNNNRDEIHSPKAGDIVQFQLNISTTAWTVFSSNSADMLQELDIADTPLCSCSILQEVFNCDRDTEYKIGLENLFFLSTLDNKSGGLKLCKELKSEVHGDSELLYGDV